MNLFFGGGSLAGLMKPHFWQKVGPKALLRNTLKQNILCKLLNRCLREEWLVIKNAVCWSPLLCYKYS